jgi:hypothetical protein
MSRWDMRRGYGDESKGDGVILLECDSKYR